MHDNEDELLDVFEQDAEVEPTPKPLPDKLLNVTDGQKLIVINPNQIIAHDKLDPAEVVVMEYVEDYFKIVTEMRTAAISYTPILMYPLFVDDQQFNLIIRSLVTTYGADSLLVTSLLQQQRARLMALKNLDEEVFSEVSE